MLRKGFLKRSRTQSDEMSLQITSMADIFTILLVFLLKSYTTGVVNVSPTKGLMLPVAHAGEATTDALKLEVSEKGIQVEGQPVAVLEKFRFDTKEVLGNGTSKSVSEALAKERKRQNLIAQKNSDVKVDPKIIVMADQRTPYETLKTVLASAAVNGYTDFKLVVAKGE